MALHNMVFNGMSGLNSMAGNMAVLGSNIANINTVSYKVAQTTFQNVLTSSLGYFGEAGNGSQVASISKNFRPGQLESTTRATDMAIAGQGFFMLRDPLAGEVLYGRDGQFLLAALPETPAGSLNLVTPAGWHVQGVNLGSVATPSDTLEGILVRREMLPQATENVSLALNLQHRPIDPEAVNPPLFTSWDGAQEPPLASGQFDYRTAVQAYDDQGRSFELNIYFDQTANSNEREFLVTIDPDLDRRLIGAGGARYNDGETPEKGAGALMYGKLIFSYTGELLDIQAWSVPPAGDFEPDQDNRLPPDPDSGLYSFAYNLGGGANLSSTLDFGAVFDENGAAGLSLSPIRTTNYATASATIFQGQDGFGSGVLQNISIRSDGVIVGYYSNNQRADQARVMLADFVNYQGLTLAANNAYKATSEAGIPLIGAAGSGTFGEVLGNSLEVSNVDLGRQFVDLMMTQRIFQANSKSLTTAGEIYDTLLRLK